MVLPGVHCRQRPPPHYCCSVPNLEMKRIWSSWDLDHLLADVVLWAAAGGRAGPSKGKGENAWPKGHLAKDTGSRPTPAQQAHCSRGRGGKRGILCLATAGSAPSSLCRVCVYLLMSVFWKRNCNFSLISKLHSTKLRVADSRYCITSFQSPWHITAQLAGTSISLLLTCENINYSTKQVSQRLGIKVILDGRVETTWLLEIRQLSHN